jgi:multidrug efflux pump subunit AcrA (membrane-fusion protein)
VVKRKRVVWIVIVVIAIVGIVGVQMLQKGKQGSKYAQETAITGDLTTYYNFSGTVEVNHDLLVTAASDTTVSEIYVQPNGIVAKNDRLMRLDDGTVLKADIAGEVTNIAVQEDDTVHTGDTLLEIMDLQSMKITFQVDEYDMSAVSLGKTAQITLDGNGDTFEGPVTAINKRATQSGDLNYYTATVDLTGQTIPENMLPGMQVTVKLQNQAVTGAVLLKIDAVSFTAQNKPYVLVPDGKTQKTVDVEVGMNDGNYVEIKQGLRAGDTVLYVPTATETTPLFMGAKNYAQ